ncbi:hypothetical protein NDU88_001127 [Pleurodeles waltl]|uniref:Uncharacterized protein n=1 Tax=Pleurodeles waltl TaxID=8319 RepID=A0AAV7P5V4_PLEWA|nr:hypothetical protein NDU88_001127 [Pleurodeles waltl]
MRPAGFKEWWERPSGTDHVQCGVGGLRALDCGGPPPQERREAIQSATAISASLAASESETENSQPSSDRPTTPDRVSELGFQECPLMTPATADKLF